MGFRGLGLVVLFSRLRVAVFIVLLSWVQGVRGCCFAYLGSRVSELFSRFKQGVWGFRVVNLVFKV